MSKWWQLGKKEPARKSDRHEIKKRLADVRAKRAKAIEFGLEETTDVIDLTLEELRKTSEEAIEKVEDATKELKKLTSIRPPAPGPVEEVNLK